MNVLLISGISEWREKDCIGLGLGGYADSLEQTMKLKQVQYWLDYFKKSSYALICLTYGFLFQILPVVVCIFNLRGYWILLALIVLSSVTAILIIFWILKLHKCKIAIDMNEI
ncbi:MAG: hypothetical protein J7K36_04755 [Archaeoglobaceae archaeon]|nr:hypothetical protein [Archaeoglobaceae archaeon]